MNLTQHQKFLDASAPRTAEKNDEIDLEQVLDTLWRGKIVIFFCVLVALLLGGYYVYSMAVPVYTARSVVVLKSRQEQIVDFENVMSCLGGDQATVNTEVAVIRSRGLMGKLVDRLDLTKGPEFNPTLRV